MKTTLSRQHKMTRAIPAKKVNLVPSSFPIRMRRDQVEVWGSEIEFLTNFYWLLENIESLDRMFFQRREVKPTWDPRESTDKLYANRYALLMLYCIYCKQHY